MSELIKKLEIKRTIKDGIWKYLELYVKSSTKTFDFMSLNGRKDRNENEAIGVLIHKFEQNFGSSNFTLKILKGFQKLREENLEGKSSKFLDVDDKQTDGGHHFSCEIRDKQTFGENEVCQTDISEKLADLDEQSETFKFYEDKKCSICLSNYKEILDENLHIVIPYCGHPLCCQCADNVLVSKSRKCPQCMRNFNFDSFNLMKFSANLEVNVQNQRIFF